ncbi:unnamed protein product [Clonostachys chloroleuca]|uniref:Uncharacterized protein n=1 Tax=Clonostachys chloroleuca TaxID=1926264 RepID=A0AA35VAW0_9HYPO|nr:unnamed protein product [Clonostachys chloroleuca]
MPKLQTGDGQSSADTSLDSPDGLDEYEGFDDKLPETRQLTDEMVTFLLRSRKEYDWKLCVSSSPSNYFRDKFSKSHSLAMQQLTQPDIDEYVNRRLLPNQAIQDARMIDQEAIETLISNLKTRAQGVFLWVVLVVEQLLITAQEDPHISVILCVFDSLPQDLNNLYNAIQEQTPSNIGIFEVIIFVYRLHGSRTQTGEEIWFNHLRKMNPWLAWQRLETIKKLLQKGAKIERYMKEILRAAVKDAPPNSVQARYVKLLLDLSGHSHILASFDEMRRKSFPEHEVGKVRKDGEFPDYQIDL